MSNDYPSSMGLFRKISDFLKRRDWLFWLTFIPIVCLKLAIFHFGASQYLFFGRHSSFGMNFGVVESFSDFSYYYMNFVRAFVQGNLPYTEALYMIEGVQTYIYTPLFVYVLGAFYFVPSELLFPDIQMTALLLSRDLNFLRVGFAFIVFDLATCAVMYAAARKLTENQFIPVVVLLLFALNPISLWWGNYLWLSTPIHTFFLVLGFFFIICGKFRWAIVLVTVAAMVKQTGALLIPLIWFLEYRQGMKQLLISVGITAIIGIIFSMPYLILFPTTYFSAITRGMGPYWFYELPPDPTHPVPVSVLAFFWPEPFKSIVLTLVYYAIPWIIAMTFFWFISYYIPKHPPSAYLEPLLLVTLLLSLSAHIFMPRGIYKFYLIALLPFLILFGVIIRGPVVPVQGIRCPIQSRGASFMAKFPSWIIEPIHQFRENSLRLVNNLTTWWFVLVGLVSIGIFSVYRYFTHVILLGLFIVLLLYGSYRYVWKRKMSKKNAATSWGDSDADTG
ncbi:MAG: hypothetical protein ACFFDU_06055 [Candidatus Thorarchaeota archaeon]